MKTKIFITGATGYIGANLALRLANSGHTVHALCRSTSKASMLNHENIKVFKGDILDKESVACAMQSCEYAYHTAAYVRVWAKQPDTYFDINVQGTLNVLDKAVELGVKKVVVTSTAGVYGPSEKLPLDEKSVRTIDFFNEYESSKFTMEEKIQHYSRNGLSVVVVSPPRVYGPGLISESNVVTKMIKQYIEGKWHLIPGDGEKIGNYVFIDDVVNGHILAMSKGRQGEKYILGGTNASYNDFFDTLSGVSRKKYRLFKIPLSFMLAFAGFQQLLANWFSRPPLITPQWVNKYLYNWALSSNKAVSELGYKATPLAEGIQKTIKWLENGSTSNKPFALITGASSGIGKALAAKCAKLKMNLILVALPGPELKEVAESLESTYNIKAVHFAVDLTEKDAPNRLYEWCMSQQLPINILINNAGIGGHAGPFEESTIDFYENMMQLNMVSLVKLTQLFIPEIKKHPSGNILNVGSMTSLFPVPYKCVYAATKSFVLSLSKALREELKNTSIKVSCLCPGATITNATLQARVEAAGWKGKVFTITSDKLAALTIKKFLKGKAVIIPAWENKMIVFIAKLIPDAFLPVIAGKLFKNLESH